MNKPRRKGTDGETQLMRLLNAYGFEFYRREAGAQRDLRQKGEGKAIDVLAIRPDRGPWLLTLDVETFAALLSEAEETFGKITVDIEVKRRAVSVLHSIWAKEMEKEVPQQTGT